MALQQDQEGFYQWYKVELEATSGVPQHKYLS